MKTRDGVESELPQLLDRADMVKFARAEVAVEEARQAGVTSRAIVDHVEARLNPESEPAKRLASASKRAA